jgi:hypothetical protein
MKSLPFWFIGLGTLFALAGMGVGIYMAASQDHLYSPAHAHNNLIGYVSMVLYGLYYKAVPVAARSRLALIHFWISLIGALTIGVGIGLAVSGQTEILASISSLFVIIGMALFAWIVWTHRAALSVE